jgi:hypothetical protein
MPKKRKVRELKEPRPYDEDRYSNDAVYAEYIKGKLACIKERYTPQYCWCGLPDGSNKCIFPRFEKDETLCKVHLQTNPWTGKMRGFKKCGGCIRTRDTNVKCDWDTSSEFPGYEWCSAHQPCLCSVPCEDPSKCTCESDASVLVPTIDRFGLNNRTSRVRDTCVGCGRYRYVQCPVSRRVRNRHLGASNQLRLENPIVVSTERPPEEFISLCPM